MRIVTLFALVFMAMPAPAEAPPAPAATVRFATFNVSMYRERAGQLRAELRDPSLPQARLLAEVLRLIRPDVVLLNEFDWDADGESLRLLRQNFLEADGLAGEPVSYPYSYVAESNTGMPSGYDLDGDGTVTSEPGSRAYGGDAFGFGQFPGQYGFAILSRYPILAEQVRTFRQFLWKDLPGALLPADWYPQPARDVLRLSSKNHVDVPIEIEGRVVHLLASHPTPPTFDGPEDRNGRRNHDEVRFWSLYLAGDSSTSWLVDDQGRRGGLGVEPFVIAGDLNSDPVDGDSRHEAIRALLDDPRLQSLPVPMSRGAAEQSRLQGGRNAVQRGDPAADTTDFDDRSVGNLRLDYVLPSIDLPIEASGVFWPESTDPLFALVGTHPFPISDHRLVWVDLRLPPLPEEARK